MNVKAPDLSFIYLTLTLAATTAPRAIKKLIIRREVVNMLDSAHSREVGGDTALSKRCRVLHFDGREVRVSALAFAVRWRITPRIASACANDALTFFCLNRKFPEPSDKANFPKTIRAGEFVRQEDSVIGFDDFTRYPAVDGRYHLYVSLACPWRPDAIVRNLKGLAKAIGDVVIPSRRARWLPMPGSAVTRSMIRLFARSYARPIKISTAGYRSVLGTSKPGDRQQFRGRHLRISTTCSTLRQPRGGLFPKDLEANSEAFRVCYDQ